MNLNNYKSFIAELHPSILREIGEGTKNPYKFTNIRLLNYKPNSNYVEAKYEFEIDDIDTDEPVPGAIIISYAPGDRTDYINKIDFDHGAIDVEFRVYNPETEIHYASTNFGLKVLNRIMDSVIAAVNDFTYKKLKKYNMQYDLITFASVDEKTTGIFKDGSVTRSKLYDAYMNKHADVKKSYQIADSVFAYTLKNPVPENVKTIKEIGEGTSKPYQIRKIFLDTNDEYGDATYSFKIDDVSDKNPTGYVSISYFTLDFSDENILEVEFYIQDKDDNRASHFDATNYGLRVLNRVMATVINAVRTFLDKETNIKPDIIQYSTTDRSSKKQNQKAEKVRDKLYTAYMNKHFDIDKKIKKQSSNLIIFHLKEQALNEQFRLTQDRRFLDDLIRINSFSDYNRKKIISILDDHDRKGSITLNQLNLLKRIFYPKIKAEKI